MSKELIGAYTKTSPSYPGYVNASRDGDIIALIVRGDPVIRENAGFICAHAHEKGQLGRCTPGDDNCNNYCNMAPGKGPMQDHPKRCEQVFEGSTVTVSFSADEWERALAAINGDRT